MADNIVTSILPVRQVVTVTDPAAPASGDPVRVGVLTGIAMDTEGTGGVLATETIVDFGYYVASHPVTDTVGGGIALYAQLYYVDAADRLENTPGANAPYGIALGVVGAGLTATINVLHCPGPAIGAGLVIPASFAANALSADAVGRAVMQDGYFDAATALAKFGANCFDNAFLLDAVLNGAFQADAASRALFADGFINGAKIATGVVVQEIVAGVDETMVAEINVTNLTAADELVSVTVFAAGVPAMRALADFTLDAGHLNVVANAANNAANVYQVIWIDHS